MDISYLLLLQDFRKHTEAVLAPIMDWITKFAISIWPIAIMIMIYWVFDRKAGKRMLSGFSYAMLMNGLLKLVVCAYRPWIRDSRIEPYGDSKVAATGYSFPSGHSTWATACWGSIGHWFHNRKKLITVIFYILIALTMFSRNYLGVHTPQDVLVGFFSSILMLVLTSYIENWSDKDPDRRDLLILFASLITCVLLAIFYFTKSYPMDYTAEGALIVDPMKMIPDSFEGIGFVSAYAICRYFERRRFAFDEELPWKDRFVIGTFALIPLIWWHNNIVNIFASIDLKILGKYIWGVGIIVYSMIVVPFAMQKLKCRIDTKENH